jgi:flavin reductase (DIM6/NTAB) family NADH-FMN oxidoreductase RutF
VTGGSPLGDLSGLLHALDPAVLVVTTAGGGQQAGCVVTFATPASISPARFLVCLSRPNHTHRVAAQADALAVHVLGAEQQALAELFGGRTGDEIDKFARCAWRAGPRELPILDGCPAWFVGEVELRIELGDHSGYLLRPLEAHVEAAETGLLRAHALDDLTPGHAP